MSEETFYLSLYADSKEFEDAAKDYFVLTDFKLYDRPVPDGFDWQKTRDRFVEALTRIQNTLYGDEAHRLGLP